MKKMKKLVGLLLTMVMVLSMTMTAFADETYSITGPKNGHTYEVYQIFKGDLAVKEGKEVLSNVKWGLNGTQTKDTDVAKNILDEIAAIANAETDSAKLAVIEKYVNLTSEPYAVLDDTNAIKTGVPAGYYLIKDEDGSVNENDSYTTYIVQVVGNVDITPKADVPEVEKKVKETNDSTPSVTDWQDAADYDIGDTIPYQLTGTVPSNIAEYETYYYEFHDEFSKGLTLNQNEEKTAYDVKVEIDGTDVTDKFTITYNNGENGKTLLSVKCFDIKGIAGVTITPNTKVVVTYNATLDTDAVVGAAGNPNDVYLEYSNNPNNSGDGINKPETGETPKDKVIVFTYVLDVNKVHQIEKDEEGNPVYGPLDGAGFKLYKKVGTNWVQVGSEIKDVTTFTFNGVDAGDYKLEESTVPAGYNKADDLFFTVEGVYAPTLDADGNKSTEAPTLTELNVYGKNGETKVLWGTSNAENVEEGHIFTVTLNIGKVETDVVNQAGATLPETGGMGTTLFYVIGAILVIGAAVMLITKKRMNNAR